MTTTEVREELKKDGYVCIFWHRDDVLQRAEWDNVTLTDEEVEAVLDLLDNKHDASIGISWDTIDCWIDYVISERIKN